MHRQVLFPQSRLLDLTILLAGVDAIRVVTIQARCHVMRKFFFMFVSVQSAIKAHTHTHICIYTQTHTFSFQNVHPSTFVLFEDAWGHRVLSV